MATRHDALVSRYSREATPVTRSHRKWHAWGWTVLGPLVLIGLAVGLFNRQPIPIQNTTSPASRIHLVTPVDAGQPPEKVP